MKSNLNQLEQLENKISKSNFIKSYTILNYLPITPIEKSIIELIYSYNDNGKEFYMNYTDISTLFNIKLQSVKNTINNLKKKGYIITNHSHNFNGIKGGSSTNIVVNIEKITEELEIIINNMKTPHLKEQNKVEAQEINNVQPIQEPQIEEKVAEKPSNEVIEDKEEAIPVKKTDIRTEKQKMEEDLFKSLVIDSDKDDSDSSETFTYTNIHDTFDIPIKFKKTLEWGLSKTIWEKKIKTSQKIFGLIAVLENIDDLLNTLNEYENKINIINNETK